MLYFFYGTDRDRARERTQALVSSLQKKKPEAEVFRLDSESASAARLDELVGGQGLFHKTYLVSMSGLLEKPESREPFLARLGAIAESPNIFVALEGSVDKKTLLEVTEAAEKVQPFEKKGGKEKPEFNIFSLTDALGRRDRKNLWVLFQKAVASGAVPEEIHGILFWQLKNILLAHLCKTAEEAGVKPFVWSKAKSFARNWSEEELKNLSSRMVALYHDAHRGIHDFEIALERLVLTI